MFAKLVGGKKRNNMSKEFSVFEDEIVAVVANVAVCVAKSSPMQLRLILSKHPRAIELY